MATYKVVVEVESDADLERVQKALPVLLNPDRVDGCDSWKASVLAVAETQSSRSSAPPPSPEPET